MTLDITRPVQTRDGRPVRIITWTEGTKEYPIVGVVEDDLGEVLYKWTSEGYFLKGCKAYDDNDLINAPERRSLYVNINEKGFTTSHQSRKIADDYSFGRIGLIRVDLEDGAIVGFEREL